VANADLAGASIGFSEWCQDGEGVKYRKLAGAGQFHVPANTHYARIPVRAAAGEEGVALEIRLDGRPVNRVPIPGGGVWENVGIVFAKDWTGRAYRGVELRTIGQHSASPPAIEVGEPALLR